MNLHDSGILLDFLFLVRILESAHHGQKEQWFERLAFQLAFNKSWKEKVVRLHLLLTVKESAINVPQNLEACRRITFFANSLFMNMPKAPKVQNMLSFSLNCLSGHKLDEWTNFLERIKDAIKDSKEENLEKEKMEFIRHWVSYRGQTLARTVRGMMYYKQALELQCFLEFAEDEAILGGYRNLDHKEFQDRAQALADLKFTYVVSCQVYGNQKKSDDARDRSCYINILNLMLTNPSLRVAYIDEREETINGKSQKLYYSVLVKGGEKLDEEIYRIKLPGCPVDVGEGKPENQNHAIIFTRGEALQTIDMNQFSSVAQFVSNQETSFVTIRQRILANPLKVRFHYGHPDIFDRIFHITRGGISKASKIINLNENISAGLNSTLRGGFITHHEYIQVGKGRDVGMNQISLFETKLANGNGEQTLSRDVYHLGHRFDFYRMLSFYFTTVGFYFSSMLAVLTVYVFLYGRMYLVLSGIEKEILREPSIQQSKALEEALVTQSVFQFGLLIMLPMVMEIDLEKGFRIALSDFIIMQLQLVSVFFMFQLGTKAHYYGRTILHGGSKYQATGRGFIVFHAKFTDNYRLYSRSHFVKGLELFILLIVYEVYGQSYHTSYLDQFITFSMWFLVASWLFAPFVFNPSGFDWPKIVDDWTDWKMWMGNRGGIGVPPSKSWESWWKEEHEHLKYTSIRGRVIEIILAFRFFVYQYGIVYHLHIAHYSKSLLVYGISWSVMVTALLVLMVCIWNSQIYSKFMSNSISFMVSELNTIPTNFDSMMVATTSTSSSSTMPSSTTSPSINLTNQPLLLLSNMMTVKLDKSNYIVWKHQISMVLETYSMIELLDEIPLVLEKFLKDLSGIVTIVLNLDYLDWKSKEKPLLTFISSTLTPSILAITVGCSSALEVWKVLENRFSSISRSHVMNLKGELHNVKKGLDSVDTYL
nr:callose synthase 7-like [Quercus suber]